MLLRDRLMRTLTVAVALTVLTGCSLLPGLGGTGDVSYEEPGDPIPYVDGTATVELTGGTVASLTLPLQEGSNRSPYLGDQVGFRDDPWTVQVMGYGFDDPGLPESGYWSMTLHDLSSGHRTSQDYTGECRSEVRRDQLHVEGTLTCDGLRWVDAVALPAMDPFASPLPDQEPFDATVTFEATLAEPAPSPGPVVSYPPEALERTVIASHIMYSPNDDPGAATELALIDPAWGVARAEAQAAADDLRAIADTAARETAFADRAKAESDDTNSGADGGSLGAFIRDAMVPEFADPLFDATDLSAGDVIGPVRTEFGWHVIMYEGEGEPAPDY